MARDELINIRVRLRDARKYLADMRAASKETKKLGAETKRAQDQAGRSRGFSMFSRNINATARASRFAGGHLRRAAGAAVAFGAGLLAIGRAKQAVNTTVDLAKTTLGLHRNLGLSIDTASQWAAVAKTRNIESKALTMGFTKLSAATNAAVGGDEKMLEMFKMLGISQKELKSGQTDFNSLILQTAEGFGKLTGGTKRQEAAQKLLGRGYTTLLPLFAGGAASLREQLNLATEYGVTFGDTTAEKMKNLIKAQREAKFASLGLEVAFGTAVAPALTKVITGMSRFVLGIRQGTGAGGRFRDSVMKNVVTPLRSSIKWIDDNRTTMKLLVGGLVALKLAFVAMKVIKSVTLLLKFYKINVIAAKVATGLFNLSMVALKMTLLGLKMGFTGAKMAVMSFTASLLANPVVLITVAVVALIAGLAILYWRVKSVRDFINKYWPLLVVPFAIVLSPIIAVGFALWRLGRRAGDAAAWIKRAFNNVVGFFRSMPGKIGKAASGMWNGIKSGFRAAINFIVDSWNNLELRIGGVEIDPPGPGSLKIPSVTLKTPNIPRMAAGGIVKATGTTIVGERGPELLRLDPGARVDPLPRRGLQTNRAPVPFDPIDFAASGATPTVLAKFFLNGREIAEAVANEIENRKAFS